MRAHLMRRLAAAGLALTGAACAGASPPPGAGSPGADAAPAAGAPPPEAPSSPAGSDTLSRAEIEALYRARRDSARMNFTEADVRFVTGMIGHHAQALVMSALAPTHGASPEIRTLAARIINSQEDEIAAMERWLRERGQPVPEVEIDGTRLVVRGLSGAEHAHHMPGMLTEEQLRGLDAARGAEFDSLFLEYMIQHHGGAVTMVEDLFATGGAAQGRAVFKLASDIQVDQRTEIARMERMLAALEPPSHEPAEEDR